MLYCSKRHPLNPFKYSAVHGIHYDGDESFKSYVKTAVGRWLGEGCMGEGDSLL